MPAESAGRQSLPSWAVHARTLRASRAPLKRKSVEFRARKIWSGPCYVAFGFMRILNFVSLVSHADRSAEQCGPNAQVEQPGLQTAGRRIAVRRGAGCHHVPDTGHQQAAK